MTDYKVSLNSLYYELDFVDVITLREFLDIELARTEAKMLDDKLNSPQE